MGALILASDEGQFGLARSIEAFRAGGDPVSCLEAGIRAVEDDPRARTVGYGGAPAADGRMSLDASIMEGTTRRCGSVGGLCATRYPIAVARAVMEHLPHVMLAGDGAERFAREIGCEQRDMLTDEAREDYHEWQAYHGIARGGEPSAPLLSTLDFTPRRNLSFGTVTFLMRDSTGRLAGGASTSGWAYKYPGRLGDSPVIGAGVYVDDRYGGATCTHTGEMTIRTAAAHSVVMHLRYGRPLIEACHLVAEDLTELSGGYLGPVIIHAMNRAGEVYVLQVGETDGDDYWVWREEEAAPTRHTPARFTPGTPQR